MALSIVLYWTNYVYCTYTVPYTVCVDHLEVKLFVTEDIMSYKKQHDICRVVTSLSPITCLFRDLGLCWSVSWLLTYLLTVRLFNSFHSSSDATLHFYQKCSRTDRNSLALIYIIILWGLARLVSLCIAWVFCVRGIYIKKRTVPASISHL